MAILNSTSAAGFSAFSAAIRSRPAQAESAAGFSASSVASDVRPAFGQGQTRPAENPAATQRASHDTHTHAHNHGSQPGTAGLLRGDNALVVQEASGGEAESSQPAPTNTDTPLELSEDDQHRLSELRARDREVRAHEAAHARVGGEFAGSPGFSFETGPDGRQYAIAGEVSIDRSPVPGDPEATIAKLEKVIRAALAPASPSDQDRAVAASARADLQAARAEAAQQDAPDETGLASGPQALFGDGSGGESDNRPDTVGGLSLFV